MQTNDLNPFEELLLAAREGRLPKAPEYVQRPTSAEAQAREALLDLARQEYAEAKAVEEPVWSALKQYGGKITADYIQHAPGRWRIAGEFADIPVRLLKRPDHLNPNLTRVTGNLDQIADAAGMSEQELKDFLSANPRRATLASARRSAARTLKHQRKYSANWG